MTETATVTTPAEKLKQFLKLRDYKRASDEQYKKAMERVNLAMEKLEAELLHHLNEQEIDNLAVRGVGTVYKTTKVSCSVENPAEFMEWLKAEGQWDALDVKANKTFVQDMMKTGVTPPGVKVSSVLSLGIQKR